MILGTLLLILVIGAGIAGAWKYRAMALGEESGKEPGVSDEMLVALARARDAEANGGTEPSLPR
jgi:hypothetical protein